MEMINQHYFKDFDSNYCSISSSFFPVNRSAMRLTDRLIVTFVREKVGYCQIPIWCSGSNVVLDCIDYSSLAFSLSYLVSAQISTRFRAQ